MYDCKENYKFDVELKSQPVCCDPYAFHNLSSFRFQIRNWTCKIEKFQSDLFDDLDGPNFLREDEGQIYNDDEPDYDKVSTLFWAAFLPSFYVLSYSADQEFSLNEMTLKLHRQLQIQFRKWPFSWFFVLGISRGCFQRLHRSDGKRVFRFKQ